jgi:hypothetical protein
MTKTDEEPNQADVVTEDLGPLRRRSGLARGLLMPGAVVGVVVLAWWYTHRSKERRPPMQVVTAVAKAPPLIPSAPVPASAGQEPSATVAPDVGARTTSVRVSRSHRARPAGMGPGLPEARPSPLAGKRRLELLSGEDVLEDSGSRTRDLLIGSDL